jgi:polyisoprenyl-teichoic acid--peptidoglycan teichoic acid transferase
MRQTSSEVPRPVSRQPSVRQGQSARSRGLRMLAILLMVAVLGMSGYASYTVYGLVRDSVSQSLNLPSFSVLSREAGLPAISIPQPVNPSVPPNEVPPAEVAAPSDPPVARQIVEETPEERINILVMGIDQRAIEVGPSRTDTMIVFTIDPKTGVAGMFSIPRDLWVPIPGYGESRINTAHFWGDVQKYPGGGPALAMKTVSYNFGFPVHYYVRLNFEGFKQIVDMIGGIDIEVPKEINDSKYPDEHYGYEPLYIPAGLVHMDGELALKYARTRKTDSDFLRSHRQQQVIIAIKDRILALNLLPSLLVKLPELTKTLSDAIQTDIPLDEMFRLAKMARSVDMTNLKTVIIDESMTIEHTTPTGAEVLLPVREKIRPVVDDLFWTPLPTVLPAP